MTDPAPRTRDNLTATVIPAGTAFQAREALPAQAEATLRAQHDASEDCDAAYTWLGDLCLRFVFSAPGTAEAPARVRDLKALGLTPVQAFALAYINAKRRQAAPQVAALADGVSTLRAPVPEQCPAWLQHRAFWRQQLDDRTPALLVAAPNHTTILFAPAGDAGAVAALRRMAAGLWQGAGARRLSNCLLRFDAQGWHVEGRLPDAPAAAPTPPAAQHGTKAEVADNVIAQHAMLHLAAHGQRVLIRSIALTFILGAIQQKAVLGPLPLFALFMAVAVYALFGYVRICSGLERSQNQKIFFMATSFIPLVGLATMIYLSLVTTRRLRGEGWRVGLFGARP
jgi:hypothetical protein